MIRSLFPNVSFNLAKKLIRASQVDVLIGMQHASWHPERAERAKSGGDCGYTGVCLDPVLADGIQPSLIRLTFQSHFSLWLKRILLIINGTEKDIVTT